MLPLRRPLCHQAERREREERIVGNYRWLTSCFSLPLPAANMEGSPPGPCCARRGTVRFCEWWPETGSFLYRDYVEPRSLWGRVEEGGRENQER